MHKHGDELLIGRILLRLGYLTEDQMAAAVVEQETRSASLGQVLISRKLLTSAQLQEALEIQKKLLARKPFVDAQGQSTLFGKKAVKSGWATTQQVNDALRLQGLAWEAERRILHIGAILVDKGVLDNSHVLSLLSKQGKTLGACNTCHSNFNIIIPTPEDLLAECPLCGGKVVSLSLANQSSVGFLEELGLVNDEGSTLHYGGGTKSCLSGLTEGSEGDFGISLSVTYPDRSSTDQEPLRSMEELLASTKSDERYVVDREINRGGMGAILSAVDRDIHRQVAMKVMLAKGRVNVDRIKRFVEEAQITGQLEHPNIVPVHELGVDASGQMFFTMMMVRGKSLAELLKEQQKQKSKILTSSGLSRMMEIFLKVCDAMAFAHSKGVIHRDLKPANIMVGQFGEVLVMDWGLSRVLGQKDTQAEKVVETIRSKEDESKTLDGMVMGTASYMPPEQAAGRIDEIDERSDIYSLGAVLFEMLTLLPPFRGRSVTDIINKVVEGKLQHPEILAPDRRIPAELGAICVKAMSLDKSDRYVSATAFASDVRLYLEGRAVSAKEDTFVESVVKLVRRNKPVFATAGVALVVVVFLSAIGIRQIVRERDRAISAEAISIRERDSAIKAQQTEVEQRRRAEKKEQEAEQARLAEARQRMLVERESYFYLIALAQRKIESLEFTEAKTLLARTPEKFRNWEWGYLKHLCHLDLKTLEGHSHWVLSIAISPDGRRIVTGSADQTAKIWDVRTGKDLFTLKGHEAPVGCVAFSIDGLRTITGGGRIVKVWNTKTGQALLTLKGQNQVRNLDVSPDGRRIASADIGRLSLWDIQTGKKLLTWKGPSRGLYSVAFSPDGQRIAAGCNDKTAKIFDVQAGRELKKFEHGYKVNSAAYSADGLRLVTGSSDKLSKIWDAQTGRNLLTLVGHFAGVRSVAFSLDGSRIVTGSSDYTLKIWDAKTGIEFLTLKGHPEAVMSVAFSPDGQWVASCGGDNTAKIWDAQIDREKLTLKGHSRSISSVSFSPDGLKAATGSWDKTAKIWDAHSGKELLTLVGHSRGISSMDFSPDGRKLATGSYDQTAKIWDLESSKNILTLVGHSEKISCLDYFPDGSRLITGSADQTVRIWDVKTGESLLTLKSNYGAVNSVAVSFDGKKIVIGYAKNTATICDAQSGRQIFTLKGILKPIWSVGFSPDSQRVIACGLDRTVKVWNVETGEEILTMKRHSRAISCAAFSPDGKRVATCSYNKVRILDAQSGRELLPLAGHSIWVNSVAFSPDGSRLISGGKDRIAIIWQARDWKAE